MPTSMLLSYPLSSFWILVSLILIESDLSIIKFYVGKEWMGKK